MSISKMRMRSESVGSKTGSSPDWNRATRPPPPGGFVRSETTPGIVSTASAQVSSPEIRPALADYPSTFSQDAYLQRSKDGETDNDYDSDESSSHVGEDAVEEATQRLDRSCPDQTTGLKVLMGYLRKPSNQSQFSHALTPFHR